MGVRLKDKRFFRIEFLDDDYLELREKVFFMIDFLEDDYFVLSVIVCKVFRVRFLFFIRRDVYDICEKVNKFIGVNMKLVIYDGLIFWQDYYSYFEVCVDLNGWIERSKGIYLVVLLRGNVLGVFGNFFKGVIFDYYELVKVFEERFVFLGQIELYRV